LIDSDRTTSLGLFRYAHSYAASASALRGVKVKATHADASLRFLYSHAIELYLKSFLLMNGVSLDDLRSWTLGHHVSALADKASVALDRNGFHLSHPEAACSPIRSEPHP